MGFIDHWSNTGSSRKHYGRFHQGFRNGPLASRGSGRVRVSDPTRGI